VVLDLVVVVVLALVVVLDLVVVLALVVVVFGLQLLSIIPHQSSFSTPHLLSPSVYMASQPLQHLKPSADAQH